MNTNTLLIYNGAIWSDGVLTPHTALTIEHGVITAVGGDELVESVDVAQRLDARGGLITPSFADAHIHAVFGGVEMLRCDLTECTSAEDVYETIAQYAQNHPDEEWILGAGWSMPFFPGGTPRKEDLDRIVPDRPVFLLNSDHHGAWANSLAFERAGITKDTPDPVDGRFERDADGTPSGTLHEGAADLVGNHAPETTLAEGRRGLLAAQERLFSYGVTCWQEAILGNYAGYPDLTEVYAQMVANQELTAKVSGALWVERDFAGGSIAEFVDRLVELSTKFESERFVLDTAKIMVDGVPENETASLLEPYLHPQPGDCSCAKGLGLSYFSPEELQELVPRLNDAGLNAHMHAIGDRAVRDALDALEQVPETVRAERRNHLAHLQIVHPDDVPRFAPLNATANIQPLWATFDDQMRELNVPILGEERVGWQYPFASLIRHGANVVCGSDWPVSTPEPWQAMHVAVNRQTPGAPEEPRLNEHEAVELHEILTAYTKGSQTLLGGSAGVIEVGAAADLAIANRNPFIGDPSEIYRTANRVTVLDGNVVYDADR